MGSEVTLAMVILGHPRWPQDLATWMPRSFSLATTSVNGGKGKYCLCNLKIPSRIMGLAGVGNEFPNRFS